jgi:hypothetical protein
VAHNMKGNIDVVCNCSICMYNTLHGGGQADNLISHPRL